jgi:integrase/recombinase XerD
MAQAKTLTKQELKRLLDVTRGGSRYVERDVTMLLLTHWCGLRVGEVAALRIGDVVDESGAVKSEIVLAAAVTKSKRARRIFVPKTMQQQLKRYVSELCQSSREHYLFSTQKNSHFTANTATQHLQRLYARAGIVGATSHSGRRTWLTELSARISLLGHVHIPFYQLCFRYRYCLLYLLHFWCCLFAFICNYRFTCAEYQL